ncbi:MAG: DUF4416 family protein [Candidatus Omnitrophota bacterium]|nr:DUF4416 family protein [Candidatus Omnitrophota bacterium]
MSKVHEHPPVKLVVGFISAKEKCFISAEKALIKKFGMIDFQSKVIAFNLTDYYESEFGKNLKRKFISFGRLIPEGGLSRIKIFTNGLEKKFSKNKKRRINIDPGYLTCAKLVLATTKDFNHRIFLNSGILAEVTLTYKKNGFCPFEWTYPDYRTKEYREIFKKIRVIYRRQLEEKEL